MTRKEYVLVLVEDFVDSMLDANKEDIVVGVPYTVSEVIRSGEVSIDEMNQEFNAVLRDALK